jgi:hypothetical protein
MIAAIGFSIFGSFALVLAVGLDRSGALKGEN